MTKIAKFTCWVHEAPRQPQIIWRFGLPTAHGGLPEGEGPRLASILMETESGESGFITVEMGDAVYDVVRRRFAHFVGENPMMTEALWTRVWEVDRMEEFHQRQLGLIDMLCWDLKSKVAGLPLHVLLGGAKTSIPAYASTATWKDLATYERNIKTCRDVGFGAYKLHAWGLIKDDIALIRALRRWVGPDAPLMFDGSAGWDYADALVVGKALQDEGYLWYEEPMREFHLGSYAKLADKLDIPILAAETSDGVHWNAASWIEARALDMTRISFHFKGGFTGSMKIAQLSDSFGMRAQVHGMGLENAQLCGAIENNDFYEQIIYDETHIHRLSDQGAISIVDGRLNISSEPGIGHLFEREKLDATAIAKTVVDTRRD
ncbi:enolase C-terminal domain-like protein [Nitratireductor sp. XY-223]|uniref:enolase C-terminal domain-like protein n=1 Tax=Nitratireductor sp. XY-223 TaxID=2561926 RepID=UPI0010AA6F75|nr:enolase C-terminal domain-like protein [Nitratireductor sp. XY-223]